MYSKRLLYWIFFFTILMIVMIVLGYYIYIYIYTKMNDEDNPIDINTLDRYEKERFYILKEKNKQKVLSTNEQSELLHLLYRLAKIDKDRNKNKNMSKDEELRIEKASLLLA